MYDEKRAELINDYYKELGDTIKELEAENSQEGGGNLNKSENNFSELYMDNMEETNNIIGGVGNMIKNIFLPEKSQLIGGKKRDEIESEAKANIKAEITSGKSEFDALTNVLNSATNELEKAKVN